MIDNNDIFQVYEQHKPQMIFFSLKKKWLKVGMDEDFMRLLVDDVLILTINSRAAKRGFTDKEHIRKFIWNVLRKKIKMSYAIKIRQAIPELTDAERLTNFALAKEIIDKNRTLGEIFTIQKERESKPYQFKK